MNDYMVNIIDKEISQLFNTINLLITSTGFIYGTLILLSVLIFIGCFFNSRRK